MLLLHVQQDQLLHLFDFPAPGSNPWTGKGHQQGNQWRTFALVFIKLPPEGDATITCRWLQEPATSVAPAVAVAMLMEINNSVMGKGLGTHLL